SSRLPAMVSRLDLPEPLGPMIATSSPRSTDRSTSRSACTSVAPSPSLLHPCCISGNALTAPPPHRGPYPPRGPTPGGPHGLGTIGRRRQPLRQLVGAVVGDGVALLRPVVGVVVGRHQAVTLQALQRRIHLTHVQRPHLTGAGFELVAQLEAVFGPFAQQGKQ